MKQQATEAAGGDRQGWLARLRRRVFPEMPDFYAMLTAQCSVTAAGTSLLAQFLRDQDAAKGLEVRRLEHQGDRLKARHLETLHRSFATPMDREDIYDAIMAVDEILNYAKTSVREIEILGVTPDPQMIKMVELVDAGTQALLLGFRCLEHEPESSAGYADQARKTERTAEKAYRGALATLFDPALQLERLEALSPAGAGHPELDRPSGRTLVVVAQMLKRREIYRHVSNAADHVAHAAQILENIVVKAT